MAKEIKPIKNKPEIISVQVMPGRVVKLQWCDAVGAEKYLVKRYIFVYGEEVGKKIDTVKSDTNVYNDTGLSEDGHYRYRISGWKKTGPGQNFQTHSAKVDVEIISLPAPELPRIENVGNKIKISWDADPEAYGYVVLRRFAFMKKATPIATLTNGESEYSDGKFAAGQLMYYQIQSIYESADSFNYSKPSNALCSVIFPAPYVMKKHKKLGKKVVFDLRINAGSDGYILFRQDEKDSEPVEIMRTESISALQLVDATKKNGKHAFYTIASYKKSAEGKEFIGEKCEPIEIKF